MNNKYAIHTIWHFFSILIALDIVDFPTIAPLASAVLINGRYGETP